MNDRTPENPTISTRRDFLGRSAQLAALAGAASAVTGYAMGGSQEDMGPALSVTAGPKPKRITAEQTIRLGIIGAGGRSQYVLQQMLAAEPNLEVVAIAEPEEAHLNDFTGAKEIAARLKKKPDWYSGTSDYKSKLLAREDIDAVLLATPCSMHAPMYLDCFAAGKHFYGEKPMAITVHEAKAMVKAGEKNPDVVAQIGFQRRATELYHKGVEMVRSGVTGGLHDCRGAWNIPWGPLGMPGSGSRVWFGRRAKSGDWMLEQACHTWDVFNWVAGCLPVAATGIGRKGMFKDIDPDRDVTDMYYAHIEYPEFFVDYEHSWICPHNDGGKFTGVFEQFGGTKAAIALQEGKIYSRDPGKQPESYASGEGDPRWTRESVQAFFNSLRHQKPVVCGVQVGHDATLVGLMVRRAVDEHRRVTMKEITG